MYNYTSFERVDQLVIHSTYSIRLSNVVTIFLSLYSHVYNVIFRMPNPNQIMGNIRNIGTNIFNEWIIIICTSLRVRYLIRGHDIESGLYKIKAFKFWLGSHLF